MKTATSGNVNPKAPALATAPLSADIRVRVYNTVTVVGDTAVPGTLGTSRRP